jgi:poly(3-hydroxybutyrate) depolymerase
MKRRHLLLGIGGLATTGLVACSQGPGRARVPSTKRKPRPSTAHPSLAEPGSGTPIAGTNWTTGLNDARGSDHLGNARRGAVYIPSSYDRDTAHPLVIGIHGAHGDGAVMFKANAWARVCEEQGWIGLFPNMLSGFEEDGVHQDPAVIEQDWTIGLAERTAAKLNVDTARQYIVGFSLGGRRAYRLAAVHSDKIAAIAVSGSPIGYAVDPGSDDNWRPEISGAAPVSILHIHGEKDPRIPMSGKGDMGGGRGGQVPTIEGLKLWADHMDCLEDTAFTPPQGCPDGVWGKHWLAPSGHEVMGLFDPKLQHTWAREWANPVVVEFLKRAPSRT